MYLFKYYRPNFYFEKSIKYDEIYFSANNELNDPLDLSVLPYFSDNYELWLNLIKLSPRYDTWDIGALINYNFDDVAKDLNSLFKDKKIEPDKTISYFIKSYRSELIDIFSRYGGEVDETSMFKNMTKEQRAEPCILFLTELLSRGWHKKFYSCSFSMNALEPMMWAHYAEGFKGCVVIYRCENDSSLNLKPHPLSKSCESYYFSEVGYGESERTVCILEHALKNDSINPVLLSKSKFWSYEQEQRLLMSESFDTIQLTQLDMLPDSSRVRLFHHSPNAIAGIIYGPNCSSLYKKKIESILVEKYSYSSQGEQAFLALETSLNKDGDVFIESGELCYSRSIGSPSPLKQQLSPEKLSYILADIGIQ
ncbi:DUF2971 domain-containing protein [Vibrio cholerae]|uniref:DUF2971 domain-containing protein n=1 Tax=Vibrio cholerae TaxID=666 RepID=UPI003F9E3B04